MHNLKPYSSAKSRGYILIYLAVHVHVPPHLSTPLSTVYIFRAAPQVHGQQQLQKQKLSSDCSVHWTASTL